MLNFMLMLTSDSQLARGSASRLGTRQSDINLGDRDPEVTSVYEAGLRPPDCQLREGTMLLANGRLGCRQTYNNANCTKVPIGYRTRARVAG